MMTRYQTAESVCKGHPDKLCDLIADSILDACLIADRASRVACEVMATSSSQASYRSFSLGREKLTRSAAPPLSKITSLFRSPLIIFIAGEITCGKKINIPAVVRRVLREVGYDPRDFHIGVHIHKQSADIAAGVGRSIEARSGSDPTDMYSSLGAGDQGTVYGYATNETTERLPLPLVLAHRICKKLDEARLGGTIKGIKPDGKAQVTVEYDDDKPVRIKTVVLSVQHDADKDMDTLLDELTSEVLWPVFEGNPFDGETEILVNPSGRFVEGGPAADTGLTGRKLMVDTYGGLAAQGGGAMSGKDCTKVDRSGAYMARAIAKNIVNAYLADRCQVGISYAIGKADPVAVDIDTFGTGKVSDEVLRKAVFDVFNLRPAAIIETLGLRRPVYARTATYGHFTELLNTWEWFDRYSELREAVAKYEPNYN